MLLLVVMQLVQHVVRSMWTDDRSTHTWHLIVSTAFTRLVSVRLQGFAPSQPKEHQWATLSALQLAHISYIINYKAVVHNWKIPSLLSQKTCLNWLEPITLPCFCNCATSKHWLIIFSSLGFEEAFPTPMDSIIGIKWGIFNSPHLIWRTWMIIFLFQHSFICHHMCQFVFVFSGRDYMFNTQYWSLSRTKWTKYDLDCLYLLKTAYTTQMIKGKDSDGPDSGLVFGFTPLFCACTGVTHFLSALEQTLWSILARLSISLHMRSCPKAQQTSIRIIQHNIAL